jgi:Protein of unknown function (DUF3485)
MKRNIFLFGFLLCGLSMMWVLPKRGNVAPSSLSTTEINMEEKSPPLVFGEWEGMKSLPTAKEREILAPDTTFIKAVYTCEDFPYLTTNEEKRYQNVVNLSIVISGHDINNSIHRPERCLVAQGHQEMLSVPTQITTPLGRSLEVRKITSRAIFPISETEPDNHQRGFISYYYFVGHKRLTSSHWSRTLMDMEDRLMTGTDQQWSFIMVSAAHDLGATPAETENQRTAVDKKIRQFLSELTDRIVDWNQINL